MKYFFSVSQLELDTLRHLSHFFHYMVLRVSRNGETLDYLICFDCHHLHTFQSGSEKYNRIGLEGPEVNDLLNKILDDAGIKRDKLSPSLH